MMQLLSRYAESLEKRRNLLIQIYEQYINACLTGVWPDFIAQVTLPDGRIISVEPYAYSQAKLGISCFPPLEKLGVYFDNWIFPTQVSALNAALTWDGYGEPNGWWRHIATGRRRSGGDPRKEYIQW